MNQDDVAKFLQKTTIELKLRGASKRTIESYTFFLKPYLASVKDAQLAGVDDVKFFLAWLGTSNM